MSFPKQADYVIIGGGIAGCAAAYYLAKAGAENIVVLEKNTFCSGSTGRCGGGIRAQWGLEFNARLAIKSIEMYEHLSEELEMDIELDQVGYLLAAYSKEEMEQFRKNVEMQNRVGIGTRFLDYEEVKRIIPGVHTPDALGYVFHDRDGVGNPFKTTFAYMEAAKRLGVRFYKFVEVTGIVVEKNVAKSVVTNAGIIEARKKIVNCAGVWSGQVGKMAGLDLPLRPERRMTVVTEPVETDVCRTAFMSLSHNYYFVQHTDGSILIEFNKVGDITWTYQTTEKNLRAQCHSIVDVLPRTRNIRVVRHFAGSYDLTPDENPLIGQSDVENFYLSCGYSGHGYMMGPFSAKLAAQDILGEKPEIDIRCYDYHRFERGEAIMDPNHA